MKITRFLHKLVYRFRGRALNRCGTNVRILSGTHMEGNINIGSNVLIGQGAYFVSANANLFIHDDVVFGPNVTIYTGDHAIDIIGRHISEITEIDKKNTGRCYDEDVVIESGCWIGTRTIILKGVTVGHGSIIGAGAIVSRDVPPYSIYTGNGKAALIRKRFTEQEIEEHERILISRGKRIS